MHEDLESVRVLMHWLLLGLVAAALYVVGAWALTWAWSFLSYAFPTM